MVNYRMAFLRNPTVSPCHHCSTPPLVFTGNIIRRQSKLSGQIVEYHETYTERVCNHIASPPTADQVKARLNQELEANQIDGWSEKVTVVQSLTQDTVHFRTYLAATQPLSPQTGIEIIVILALFLAISIVVVVFTWMVFSQGSAALERFRDEYGKLRDRLFDEIGNVWDTIEEITNSMRQRFWMVCDKCGLGFGPFSEYATYESIPEAIKQAFRDHSRICNGFLPPTPPICENFTTQAECEAAGCYWYDGACHPTPQTGCNTDAECAPGYKCVDGECVRKACADYKTQADCEDAGCYWYDESCHALPKFLGWPFPILSRLSQWFPFLKRFLP